MSPRSARFTPFRDQRVWPLMCLEGRMPYSRMMVVMRCLSVSPAREALARCHAGLPQRNALSSAVGPQALPATTSWLAGVADGLGASSRGDAAVAARLSARKILL